MEFYSTLFAIQQMMTEKPGGDLGPLQDAGEKNQRSGVDCGIYAGKERRQSF